MTRSHSTIIALIAGAAAAGGTFTWSAMAEQSAEAPIVTSNVSTAIFFFFFFWCTEADFDMVDGVVSTPSAYIGGTVDHPKYRDVTSGKSGHYEAVKISYDPVRVSYEDLVDYYFHTIDPTDPDGQFCDKGSSYRTAVFVNNQNERDTVNAEIGAIEESGVLPGPVVTKVIDAPMFWPAEDYHQNYHNTTSVKYRFYRKGCGRDAKLDQLWGDAALELPNDS